MFIVSWLFVSELFCRQYWRVLCTAYWTENFVGLPSSLVLWPAASPPFSCMCIHRFRPLVPDALVATAFFRVAVFCCLFHVPIHRHRAFLNEPSIFIPGTPRGPLSIPHFQKSFLLLFAGRALFDVATAAAAAVAADS